MCPFWLFLQRIEVPLTDKPYCMASFQHQSTSVDPNVHGQEVSTPRNVISRFSSRRVRRVMGVCLRKSRSPRFLGSPIAWARLLSLPTVVLCYRGPAHLPRCLHRVLLPHEQLI